MSRWSPRWQPRSACSRVPRLVSANETADGDRGRRHRHRDPHRGDRRRRQPDRSRTSSSAPATPSKGFAQVHQRELCDQEQVPGRSQARGRLLRLAAESQRRPATAEIQACTNDLAMVGTSALLVNSVDDMRNCKDHAGATTGIPDIPFITRPLVQQCSDESFPIVPPTIECATKDQHPQTYDCERRSWLLLHQEVRRSPRDLRLQQRLDDRARRSRSRAASAASATPAARARAVRSDGDFASVLLTPSDRTHSRPSVQAMKTQQLELRPVRDPVRSARCRCARKQPCKASPTR